MYVRTYFVVKNVNSKPDPKYVGCYVDKKKRDLNGKKYLNSSKMTIKKCARYCKGYKFMGVQVSDIVHGNKIMVTFVSNN